MTSYIVLHLAEWLIIPYIVLYLIERSKSIISYIVLWLIARVMTSYIVLYSTKG